MPNNKKSVRRVYTIAFGIALLEYAAVLAIGFGMFYYMSKTPGTPLLQVIRLLLPVAAVGIVIFDFRFKYRDFRNNRC